jgi:hypothetical protein
VDFYANDDYAIIPALVAGVLIAPDGTASLTFPSAAPPIPSTTTTSVKPLNFDGWNNDLSFNSSDIQWCKPDGTMDFVDAGWNGRGATTNTMHFSDHSGAEAWVQQHLNLMSSSGGTLSCSQTNNPSFTLTESNLAPLSYKGYTGFSERYDTIAQNGRFGEWDDEFCVSIGNYVLCSSDLSRLHTFVDAVK